MSAASASPWRRQPRIVRRQRPRGKGYRERDLARLGRVLKLTVAADLTRLLPARSLQLGGMAVSIQT
ncbi:MAG: hypothetical protein NVSMB29_19340 [Candidatus Dormibacteria bacterium]